jgi:hypothetical protein
MRVLFAVFVLSILALIWTAIAVGRHIRRHEANGKQHAELPEETVTVPEPDDE